MIHKIEISKPYQEVKSMDVMVEGEQSNITTLMERIAVARAEHINNMVLQELYNIYALKGYTAIVAIDEKEFEAFLKKYLPKWKKEQEKNEKIYRNRSNCK